MKSICKKITQNRKDINDLETKNRVLTDNLIKEYGNVMEQETFWEWCAGIREEMEKRKEAVGRECYEQGIHNFFCHMFHSYPKQEEVDFQDIVDFVFTYGKVVRKVSSDDSIWEHASQFEYMSDDGWHDFTDFLPMEGPEVYQWIIDKGGKEMPNGFKPWNRDHEAYVQSTLSKKLTTWANHGLTEDEEDEIWV
jgi:uncharacterized protein YozE (UPF0346 family)